MMTYCLRKSGRHRYSQHHLSRLGLLGALILLLSMYSHIDAISADQQPRNIYGETTISTSSLSPSLDEALNEPFILDVSQYRDVWFGLSILHKILDQSLLLPTTTTTTMGGDERIIMGHPTDAHSLTALHYAALVGSSQLVSALVDRGFDINAHRILVSPVLESIALDLRASTTKRKLNKERIQCGKTSS